MPRAPKPAPPPVDVAVARSIDTLAFDVDRLARIVEDLEHAVRKLPDRLAAALGKNL